MDEHKSSNKKKWKENEKKKKNENEKNAPLSSKIWTVIIEMQRK